MHRSRRALPAFGLLNASRERLARVVSSSSENGQAGEGIADHALFVDLARAGLPHSMAVARSNSEGASVSVSAFAVFRLTRTTRLPRALSRSRARRPPGRARG